MGSISNRANPKAHRLSYQVKRCGYLFTWLLVNMTLASLSFALANEGKPESKLNKTVETGNNFKKNSKKVAQGTKESRCAKDATKCLSQKSKRQMSEGRVELDEKATDHQNTKLQRRTN